MPSRHERRIERPLVNATKWRCRPIAAGGVFSVNDRSTLELDLRRSRRANPRWRQQSFAEAGRRSRQSRCRTAASDGYELALPTRSGHGPPPIRFAKGDVRGVESALRPAALPAAALQRAQPPHLGQHEARDDEVVERRRVHVVGEEVSDRSVVLHQRGPGFRRSSPHRRPQHSAR